MDPTPPRAVTSTARAALVVGGTGMLAGVVRGLVDDGFCTAVVGRRESVIRSVASGTAHPAQVLVVPSDYTDPDRFRVALLRARGEAGPFRTAVLWIHTPSRESALPFVCEVLTDDALVVDVRGSAAADPMRHPPSPHPALAAAARSHRTVVLGFTEGPRGPRWLSHQEISDGVLAVVRAPESSDPDAPRIVGRVRPWHDRP